MQRNLSNRKRPYVNQAKRSLYNVFKQSATITSQGSIAEQMAHLQFQKQSVRVKQIKALLDEYPEHFIVNEGKEAKKFFSDGTKAHVSVPLPPVYCAWPSFALRLTETEQVGLNPLMQGILLASCRYNNQTDTRSIFDTSVGIMQLEQEAFQKELVEISMHALFTFYFLDYQTIVQSASHNWIFFQNLCATPEFLQYDDQNPIMYLYDHVTPIEVNENGPYSMDVNLEAEYENLPLIVIFYIQMVKLFVDADILPKIRPQQETLTVELLGQWSQAILKFLKSNQIETNEIDEKVYAKERGTSYFQSILEFLPLAMYLNTGWLQPEIARLGIFASSFVAMLDLLQLRMIACHAKQDASDSVNFSLNVDGMPRVEVLFQIQGLTQTPGFGLLHIPTNELLRSKILAVSGVTPESREYLQLVATSYASVAARPMFPATTQLMLHGDSQIVSKAPVFWELKSAKPLARNVAVQYKAYADQLKELSTMNRQQQLAYAKNYLGIWQDAFAVEEDFKDLPRGNKAQLERVRWQITSRIEKMNKGQIVDLFDEETDFLPLFKLVGKQDEYNKTVATVKTARETSVQNSYLGGRDFRGSLMMRQQHCNYSVYDRLTLLRSTANFMETDAQFFNGGYSKLSSSMALTVECCHSTYTDRWIDGSVQGTWATMTQQSKVLAETFQRSKAENIQEDATYGDMLTALLLNSTVTQERHGVWQPNIQDLPDDLLNVRYYDSLASVNEQFCSQLPTMFVVRYDQNRLRDDQKISANDDEASNQLIDRIIYMEPSGSFVDSYRLGQRVLYVEEYIRKMSKKHVEEKKRQAMASSEIIVPTEEEMHGQFLNDMYGSMHHEGFKSECDSVERRYIFFHPEIGNMESGKFETELTSLMRFSQQTSTTITIELEEEARDKMEGDSVGFVAEASLLLKTAKKVVVAIEAAVLIESRRLINISVDLLNRDSKLGVILETYINYEETDAYLPTPSYMAIHDRINYKPFKLKKDGADLPASFMTVQDYIQVNVQSIYLGTKYRMDFDDVSLRQAMKGPDEDNVWSNYLSGGVLPNDKLIEIASVARLMHSFDREGMSLTAVQIFDFLKTVANSDSASQRRFLVRIESPKQRIAFADYIESMSVTTFTAGLTKKDFEFGFEDTVSEANKLTNVGVNTTKLVTAVINQHCDYDNVYFNPSYFPVDGIESPGLDPVYFTNDSPTTHISILTSFIKLKRVYENAFSSRPQWSLKSSTTYTRKSVTPGLQLLRLQRDLTDQIAINHPTVRVLEKKSLNSTYMFRDMLIHLSKLKPIDEAQIKRQPEDGMFRDEDGSGAVMLPEFSAKSTQLYMNSYVSDRIMKLLGSSNLNSPGMTSQFARHVGVPFFTPMTRLQILNNTARAFQIRFAEAATFGGQPIIRKRGQLYVSETPVLGAIYTNVVPMHNDDTPAMKIWRLAKNWTDLFGYFMNDCLPTQQEVDLVRTYHSKYTIHSDKTWASTFPLVVQQGDAFPSEHLSFTEKTSHTGLLRARYLLQATHYELSKLFDKEHNAVGEQNVKALLAVALVYKDTLMKYLTSVKFTIGMYQDNPFLIESFAQVYFQGVRQQSVGDLLVMKHNPKVKAQSPPYTEANSRFEYSSNSDVQQTATGTDLKFQHLLVSVFCEQLLSRQGCPIDPFVVMKDFVLGKISSLGTYVDQMFSISDVNKVNKQTASQAALLIVKQKSPALRYADAMKTTLTEPVIQQAFNKLTPYQCSLWDQYQTKFVGDPQLLFEVFMETYHLSDGNSNTTYVLNKIFEFKQQRFNLETRAASRICPQFCSFKDPAQNSGFNARATLMDHAIDVVNRLFVPQLVHKIDTHKNAQLTFFQIVKDIAELCQFVCNIFSLQMSAYSRGQTKGTKDTENFQMLRMIQMYASELQHSFGVITTLFEEKLKVKMYYTPFVRPVIPQAGQQPGGQVGGQPEQPAPVQPVSELEFAQHVTALREPNHLLIESDEIAVIQQTTKILKDNLRMIVQATIYLPRVSQNETMNAMNQSVVDVSHRYQAQVDRDTAMSRDLLTFVDADKVKGYFGSLKIVVLPTDLMKLFRSVLLTMTTGLQFKETVYQTKDDKRLSILDIEPIMGLEPLLQKDELNARHVSSSQFAEKVKELNNPDGVQRALAEQILTAAQQKYVQWLHVQRRLTDFVKDESTAASAQNKVTTNLLQTLLVQQKSTAKTVWSTTYLEATKAKFPVQG